MRNPLRVRIGAMVILLGSGAATLFAGEPSSAIAENQPFVTFFVSSLSKFRTACELIFESVDRQDLFHSMDSRLQRYNDFAGIDRSKPLGMMFTWSNVSTPFIVFLPVTDIDDLLKTATFGVVGFHQVGQDHYEIERVQKPYQVLVRKGNALIAESVQTLQALRTTPEQVTRRLRDRYDLAVTFDFRQIPQAEKSQRIATLKAAVEPLLQTADSESAESGRLRKAVGTQLLNVIERAVRDTQSLTIGICISPDDGHLHIDVQMEALPKSALAKSCNRYCRRKSPFAGFLEPDTVAAAVAVINLTGFQGIVQEIAGLPEEFPMRDSPCDIVLQLAGERLGDLSLVAAVNGSEMNKLNDAVHDLLKITSTAGRLNDADEDFEAFKGVSFHELMPPALPDRVTEWIGSAPSMVSGESKQTVWFGIGSPKNLLDDLKDAIEIAAESPGEDSVLPIAQVRIRGQSLPELVASNPLIPNMDAVRVREELARGDDEVTLKIEPIRNGVKMKIDFAAGFVRLVGRDWIRQIEAISR